MKIRWTLSMSALALIVGAFPAFAYQGQLPPPKSPEHKKLDRKIDGAATTPYMTPQQGSSLKKAIEGGERMKADEKLTDPFQPAGQGAPAPGNGEVVGNWKPEQQPPADPPKEEAKPEPEAPAFRLKGTVCGKGADLAIFDKGGEWPAMLKVGDKLDESTTVIAIERGMVRLERTVLVAPPMRPAPPVPPGVEAPPPTPAPKPTEKKERYELYTW